MGDPLYCLHNQIWTFILDRCVHENIWEINYFFFISETKTNGKAYIFDCRYSTLCRQIVTDEEGRVQEFDFESDRPRVTLKGKIENSRFGNSILVTQWAKMQGKYTFFHVSAHSELKYSPSKYYSN